MSANLTETAVDGTIAARGADSLLRAWQRRPIQRFDPQSPFDTLYEETISGSTIKGTSL